MEKWKLVNNDVKLLNLSHMEVYVGEKGNHQGDNTEPNPTKKQELFHHGSPGRQQVHPKTTGFTQPIPSIPTGGHPVGHHLRCYQWAPHSNPGRQMWKEWSNAIKTMFQLNKNGYIPSKFRLGI
eukprot:8919577-Ditylum_brightwellii.AAC.1